MKNVYRATDGKLFDDKQEAMDYEHKIFLVWINSNPSIDLIALMKEADVDEMDTLLSALKIAFDKSNP